MSVVDLKGLYPPQQKFMVYHHAGCCQFWIERQFSADTIRTCPMCQVYKTWAIVGYAKKEDAVEYRQYLVAKEARERYEFQLLRILNCYMVVSEETRKLEEENRGKITPSGTFFNNWQFYAERQTFPQPEELGFNKWRNSILQPTLRPYPFPTETYIGASFQN